MFLSVRARQTWLSEHIGCVCLFLKLCALEFSLNFETYWCVFSDVANVEKLQFWSWWPAAVSHDKEQGWWDKTGQSLPQEQCTLSPPVSRVNGFIISYRLRIVGWPRSQQRLSRKFYQWLKAADSWQLDPLTVITSVRVKSINISCFQLVKGSVLLNPRLINLSQKAYSTSPTVYRGILLNITGDVCKDIYIFITSVQLRVIHFRFFNRFVYAGDDVKIQVTVRLPA